MTRPCFRDLAAAMAVGLWIVMLADPRFAQVFTFFFGAVR